MCEDRAERFGDVDLEDRSDTATNQGVLQPSEAGRDKEHICPESLRKE